MTEADIVNGTFTNNVKATFSGVDKEYTGTDTVDKFEESRPHMTITKVTKDAGKNHIYKLGETINYVITVENDGNLTLTNVKMHSQAMPERMHGRSIHSHLERSRHLKQVT